tara:strand:+ start:26 stop:679 length:654 start_codon:yes stop_codon:yes gene_type:complete
MSNIDISVIIPVYNRENLIARCIRSLLNQSISKISFEIIIINDCSNDNTENVVKSFGKKVKYFKNNNKKGLPYSLNYGIKKSNGRFIVRVDSDDYVHSDYLKILSAHLKLNDNIDAVCCDYITVDENDKHIKTKSFIKEPIGCCIMFRAEQLIKIGLYDQNIKFNEDKDLLIRFIKKYKIYNCPIPLYRYLLHKNSMSKNLKMMKFYNNQLKVKYKI